MRETRPLFNASNWYRDERDGAHNLSWVDGSVGTMRLQPRRLLPGFRPLYRRLERYGLAQPDLHRSLADEPA